MWSWDEHMKRIFALSVYALAVAACAVAQTATKPGPSGVSGKAEAASSQDMNIRAYIELLRTDVRKSKSQIVGAVMDLDTDEASRFWPIYKEFEAEYAKVGDQIVAAIKSYAESYGTMTDAVAADLGDQVLSIEQQRTALKKKYFDRFKEAMGGITATRFLQVENQLERILDLQIAADLPIIGER